MKSLILVAALLAACHDEDVSRRIGASCDQKADCDERCLTGGKFPGGLCSISCDSSSDCPIGTVCMADEGGACVYDCNVDADCEFLQDAYRCVDKDLKQTGEKARVCLGG